MTWKSFHLLLFSHRAFCPVSSTAQRHNSVGERDLGKAAVVVEKPQKHL